MEPILENRDIGEHNIILQKKSSERKFFFYTFPIGRFSLNTFGAILAHSGFEIKDQFYRETPDPETRG